MSEHIHHVKDDTFDSEVIKSGTPVLLDFWAEWCGPCKAIAPILDDLAADYAGKLKVAKMNVDENQATPAQFGVRGIPTVILFKNGEEIGRISGGRPKGQFKAFIDSHI